MMTERLKDIRENCCGNYILPFLWMKGEEHSVIAEELDRIQECGIQEVCLESRPHPDFCKNGWWNDLDFIMEEARRRKMRVWVLDDKKFPTGYANGAFEEKYPQLSKIYLGERHVDIMGPCRNSASLIGNFFEPDGELLAVLACPKPDGDSLAVSGDGILDLTENYKDGFVYYNLPEGAYRLFVFFTTRKGGGRECYMNLIDSRSVQVLIDEVYEKHYERYKNDFGKTFAGFFSDEPEIGNVPGYPFDCLPGKRDIRLPWSSELEQRLRKDWGKHFSENLPSLWYETGETTPVVREQYMDAVTDLVYKCFSGQIGQWCEEHGVEYIGHIIEDDNAHARLGCSIGHYFREMKGQHMAGIDVVHHQIVPGFTHKIHQWIAGDSDGEFFHFGLAKLASSAAHLDENKKGRALCECFGNYGWAEGVSFMKWLANHMLVRGINHYTPHAFAMSYPDRDCPPHFYARGNNPQFEVFACLMKYMNRAAHLLSVGKPVREAAVLYHGEAEWTGEEAEYFQKPLRVLMENQMDADVVPDDAFDTAMIEEGKLKIGTESYPALIIPGCKRMPAKAARFIQENDLSGLPVFMVDMMPDYDVEGCRLTDRFYRKVRYVYLRELGAELKKTVKYLWTSNQDFPDLRSYAVKDKESLICMFFNENIQKKAKLSMQICEGNYVRATVADLWNNRTDTYSIEQNRIPLDLEPGEARFLVLEEKAEEGEKVLQFPVTEGEIYPEQDWKVSRKKYKETEFKPIFVIRPGEDFPNMNGPEMEPEFTGTYRYETVMNVNKEPGLRYIMRIPGAGDTAELCINGISAGYMAGFPDKTDITALLKNGANNICIDVTTTLVWERKDGASTHLQIMPTGLWMNPSVEIWDCERKGEEE